MYGDVVYIYMCVYNIMIYIPKYILYNNKGGAAESHGHRRRRAIIILLF